MDWGYWIIAGLILSVGELFIPTGFVLLFLGFASFVTGVIVACGFGQPEWTQLVVFLVALFGSMLTLRQPMRKALGLDHSSKYSEFIGQDIVISSELMPGQVGQGELRGAQWKVKNIGAVAIAAGARCKIINVDGLTVEVSN